MIPKKAQSHYQRHKPIIDLALEGKHPSQIATVHQLTPAKISDILAYARKLGMTVPQTRRGPKPEINHKVIQLALAGESRRSISRVTGVPEDKISKMLTIRRKQKMQIGAIPANRAQTKREMILILYNNKLSIQQISLLVELDPATISHHIKILSEEGKLKRRKTKSRFLRNPKQKKRAKEMEFEINSLVSQYPRIISLLNKQKGKTQFEKLIRLFGTLKFNGIYTPQETNRLSELIAKETNLTFKDANKIVLKTLVLFFYKG